MPKPIKRDTEIRAALESVGAELAVIRRLMPLTQLRLEQAKDRSGLDGLLSPALDEIGEINKAVAAIADQINTAMVKLLDAHSL